MVKVLHFQKSCELIKGRSEMSVFFLCVWYFFIAIWISCVFYVFRGKKTDCKSWYSLNKNWKFLIGIIIEKKKIKGWLFHSCSIRLKRDVWDLMIFHIERIHLIILTTLDVKITELLKLKIQISKIPKQNQIIWKSVLWFWNKCEEKILK